MLAKINWTFFFKEELYEQNMPALLISMGKVINEKDEAEIGEFDDSKTQLQHILQIECCWLLII